MPHVVLVGDSIFDNAAYVPGRPAVIDQLNDLLPPDWKASLLAVDGSVVADVAGQLARCPRDGTHLVISAGGNDALSAEGAMMERAATVGEAVARLADTRARFARDYAAMADAAARLELPAALCTIYYPRLPDPVLQQLAVTGLSLFNDVILLEACRRGWPVLDLRLICDSDADYANPIEPSEHGGAKITRAIRALLQTHDFSRRRTQVFVR